MSDSEPTKKQDNGVDNEGLSQFFESNPRQTVVYQYLCPACNRITEERFIFGDADSSTQCQNPECRALARKIISTPNVLTGIPINEARRGRGKG